MTIPSWLAGLNELKSNSSITRPCSQYLAPELGTIVDDDGCRLAKCSGSMLKPTYDTAPRA